ncbi:DsbA family protein [Temperatibacter marinus]|uniref:2-hydroxychromene-2-carboxylate isomerase n=1 Tax=Temperatibacter marinus TaxID=1456591 RepID=A0AA52H999_9PROT|nr:DsbA family protein [Temperatibacter marinus]WND02961.1 DsbA family protein [Temperatibacter marinus]
MPEVIDFYFSFRSPYSYLAVPGAIEIQNRYNVDINFRPVLPQALRNPAFFKAANREKVDYILMDWTRRAELLNMPHAWPSPDPVVQNMETFEIATEQPYIYTLIYLGIEANRQRKGLEFAKEVSSLIWGGTKDWHQGGKLALATVKSGLDYYAMEKAVKETSLYEAELSHNHQDHNACGHSGVPTFVYKGEPFFGQDRLDSLCFQLEKDSLRTETEEETL